MNAMSQMLLADPYTPMVIWLLLVLISMPALLLLASPQAMGDPGRLVLKVVAALRRNRLEAVETVRYAEEMQVAATRAHEAAERWQEFAQQAEEHTETAWQTWQRAEQQATRAQAAAAFATPETTPSPYALSRTLRTAVDRGDLPAAALSAQAGWDPHLHPARQELVVWRAIAAHRYHLYRQATAAEQTAQHDTRLALAARDSLHREAATAAARAAAVRRRSRPDRQRRSAPTGRLSWIQRTA
jgi:hypothetical protein